MQRDMTTEFLFKDLRDYWHDQRWYGKMFFPIILTITVWSELFDLCHWAFYDLFNGGRWL